MMESSNLDLDLHHQEEFHASSSSLALPSLQDLILNNTISLPMVQELGFQWGIDPGESYLLNQEDNYQPKSTNQYNMKEHGVNINLQDQYSSTPSHVKHEFNQMNGFVETNYEPMSMDSINSRRGSFSMVLPSANVSSFNYMNPLYSASSLGMSQPSFMINNNIDLMRETNEFCIGQLQQESTHASMSTADNQKVSLSSVISGVTEAKRSSSCSTLNCKASQTAPKKPRFESRSSFTPFKVRKEKLGDRIAALQQLVSPFGKTDTASVLMEATGYIKFLQHQVETLSVPYMSNYRRENSQHEASDEEKRDLRSRGLCLVPLSCMSYVTNENGGVWSPTNYRGGT